MESSDGRESKSGFVRSRAFAPERSPKQKEFSSTPNPSVFSFHHLTDNRNCRRCSHALFSLKSLPQLTPPRPFSPTPITNTPTHIAHPSHLKHNLCRWRRPHPALVLQPLPQTEAGHPFLDVEQGHRPRGALGGATGASVNQETVTQLRREEGGVLVRA
jgi:hypothetical protein